MASWLDLAELKYGEILAVGGRGSELWLKFRKTESPVFLVLQLVMYVADGSRVFCHAIPTAP